MKLTWILIISFVLNAIGLTAQPIKIFADSVAKVYKIPELAFAVVSADNVIEQHVLGEKQINSGRIAELTDKFRIGSNTKTITSLIAALLVKQHKIGWDTKFFDVFPELKRKSNKAYHELTLLNLLSFRTTFISWTYTNTLPDTGTFKGSEKEQRLQFMKWILAQKPNNSGKEINFTNPSYVAAGMMLEKCSGKEYRELVNELGEQLTVKFYFGQPNLLDSIHEPWGHDSELNPEPPKENIKLNWLLPAGNISMSLPDYCRFIQAQMVGLSGNLNLLTQQEFNFLFHSLPVFSLGWYNKMDKRNNLYFYHGGNPGTFLSKVYVFQEKDRAFILLSNCQSEEAETGLEILSKELQGRYLDQ